MKLEEKIKIVKKVLVEKEINEKEFLIYLAEGINPLEEWEEYEIEDLYKINLEYDEEEMGKEYNNEEELVEVINMWIGEVDGDGFLGDGTL